MQRSILFLWHFHQPPYLFPQTRVQVLPWVRLHAMRGYFDMLSYAGEGLTRDMTYNFSGSLVEQLAGLQSGGQRDLYFELFLRDPADLSTEARIFLLDNFFQVNLTTKLLPNPGYAALHARRGADFKSLPLSLKARVLAGFSAGDLFDLQVWFYLAWFGWAALREFPELAEMRRRGSGFTHDDKRTIERIQARLLDRILSGYAGLWREGAVELTFTPHNHPILPLLIDTGFARQCMPGREIPLHLSRPGDAERQLATSRGTFIEAFGRAPSGMWPAEGSVCDAVYPLAARHGVDWLVTDQTQAQKSFPFLPEGRLTSRPLQFDDGGGRTVAVFFRNKELSDRLSFKYSQWDDHYFAAADIVNFALDRVAPEPGFRNPCIVAALDGENPWESFRDSGRKMFSSLRQIVDQNSAVELSTFSSYLERRRPAGMRVAHIEPGSWIDADFSVWIGEERTNRAWRLLSEVRAQLGELTADSPAWEYLLRAEASDWFWWYSNRFSSSTAETFDQLFRANLAASLRAAGLPVAPGLSEPLTGTATAADPLLPPLADEGGIYE